MGRDKYQTNSKREILDYIKEYNDFFSVKDLYKRIICDNKKIGLTTIYRFLEENSDILKKISKDDGVFYYRYLEKCDKDNHFYLKCNICNRLIHIDCDCINDLQKHITSEHDFLLDNKNIIMDGICHDCRRNI